MTTPIAEFSLRLYSDYFAWVNHLNIRSEFNAVTLSARSYLEIQHLVAKGIKLIKVSELP